MSNHTAAEQ